MSYLMSPTVKKIARSLGVDGVRAEANGNRSDEELTAPQLEYRIVEADKRHRRIGWGTLLATAGGTIVTLIKILG